METTAINSLRNALLAVALMLAITASAQEVTDYGISINWIPVTSENAGGVTGNGITGSITYDAESNTLTMSDASFYYIDTNNEQLTIALSGDNIGWNEDGTAIYCQGDLHIKGSGHLQILSFGEQSCMVGGSLTISDNCFIEVYYNIAIGNTLTVDNSILQTTSLRAGSIELVGCRQACDNPIIIYCPENDSPQFYGLWVAHIPVTTYSADNIISPYIRSGNASYDCQTNTLTLNNMVTYEYYSEIIDCLNNDLNIELNGDNVLDGYLKGENVYVSGDGLIEIYTIEGSPFWMSNLVLEGGCEFASGTSAQSGDVYINSLTVNNSTFRFFLSDFDLYIHSLNLINAAIEDNPNIIYDPETGHFTSIVNYWGAESELVISPTGSTAIRDIVSEDNNPGVLYDMQGRRVAEPSQPGIYVRNGKKIVVK